MSRVSFIHISVNEPLKADKSLSSETEVTLEVGVLKRHAQLEPGDLSPPFLKGNGEKLTSQLTKFLE